ncbi:unnamed protein product [Calypogeia fissa]
MNCSTLIAVAEARPFSSITTVSVCSHAKFAHDGVSISTRQEGLSVLLHPGRVSRWVTVDRSPIVGPPLWLSDRFFSRLTGERPRSLSIRSTDLDRPKVLPAVEEKSTVAIGEKAKVSQLEERKKVKVPVLDIGGLFGEAEARERTVQEIKAAAQFGYFFIINHGIDTEVLANQRKTAAKFFQLPLHEKEKSSSMETSELRVVSYGIQNTSPTDKRPIKLRRETYITKDTYRPSSPNKTWPTTPSEFKEVVQTYERELLQLQLRLLKVLAEGIGLSPTYIDNMLPDPVFQLTTLKYHPFDSTDLPESQRINSGVDLTTSSGPGDETAKRMGMTPHTDITILVILMQDEVDGVDCWTQGQWVRCEYPEEKYPGASLLVMVGEWMEVLSNGVYHSPLHRVMVHPTKFRVSTIGSIDGPPGFSVGPAPELINVVEGSNNSTAIYKMTICNERMLHVVGSNEDCDPARLSKSSLRIRSDETLVDASRDIVVTPDGQALLGGQPFV